MSEVNEAKVLNWKFPLDSLRTFEVHAVGPFSAVDVEEIEALFGLILRTIRRCPISEAAADAEVAPVQP